MAIKKDCIESHGQFDPILRNVDADGDLWMRYSALKLRLCALKSAPLFLREHGKQTSKKREYMTYGSELTRIRILGSLERRDKLPDIIRKISPFLPIILKAKKHLDRPLVSEFLFNYIIENKNRFHYFVFKSAKNALNDVREHEKYRNIDKIKFGQDLELLAKSETFTKFEANLQKMV